MSRSFPDWVTRFDCAVTVCDADLKIVYMNDAAKALFHKDNPESLIGSDLPACHNDNSNRIIRRLMTEGGSNIYTIEKRGVKKLIHQSAYRDEAGNIAGLVELSIILPSDMPHHVRGQEGFP